jgi:hypothetical protein
MKESAIYGRTGTPGRHIETRLWRIVNVVA